jgi:hypothetical protein
MNKPPKTTRDLLPSERRFLRAMHELRFGHFQDLRVHNGELVLDPAPVAVRQLKFGAAGPAHVDVSDGEFDLKQPVARFFQYVRSVQLGEIRLLQIHNGLPMLAEEEQRLFATTFGVQDEP